MLTFHFSGLAISHIYICVCASWGGPGLPVSTSQDDVSINGSKGNPEKNMEKVGTYFRLVNSLMIQPAGSE